VSDARAAAIVNTANGLAQSAGALVGEWMKSAGEAEEINAKHLQALKAKNLVSDARNLHQLKELESNLLRPLAQWLRQYARRCHVQVVRCPWPFVEADPNKCAIIAGAGYDELAAAAHTVGLRTTRPAVGQPAEYDLWRQIASAELLVVDLRDAERNSEWPRICYSMGLALAIGRVVVVATDCPLDLPFDVNIIPFKRDHGIGGLTLAETIAEASCHVPMIPRRPSTVVSAANYALQVEPPDTSNGPTGRLLRERSGNSEDIDPIAIRRAIERHVAKPEASYRVEFSSFKPVYPQPGQRRCFHVLPFALPDWVTEAVKQACEPAVLYERGDTVPNLQVLDRIWNGIGAASVIVIDLTGVHPKTGVLDINTRPNPNVCIEFGVARVLGRRIILCHDHTTWDSRKLFREIAHLSVETYSNPVDLAEKVRSQLVAQHTV
jgi:hypothetical protein